jgi:hypothetical protein
MRVLQRSGGNVDVHLVATQFGGERAPFRNRGENLERGMRGKRRERKYQRQKTERTKHICSLGLSRKRVFDRQARSPARTGSEMYMDGRKFVQHHGHTRSVLEFVRAVRA